MEINPERAAELMLDYAKRLITDAGFGGRWGDDGAGEIAVQVDVFRAGLAGRIPQAWLPVLTRITQEDDPEWQDYQKLKAKFGKL